MVDIDDGRGAAVEQRLEQPQLGGEVGLEGLMIIEMIAGDVGEAARRNAQAVEPELIEAVRRRFDGQMGDSLAGECVDRTMQLDRIRCGQRAVNLAARRDDTDGADAGRAKTQRAPNLPRKRRDRRFAAGAGDGGDGFGLARIKFRRGQRQRAPSALLPAIATNTSPRLTARLSAVTPPTSRSAWRGSMSASGGRISRSFISSFLVARSILRPRPYLFSFSVASIC